MKERRILLVIYIVYIIIANYYVYGLTGDGYIVLIASIIGCLLPIYLLLILFKIKKGFKEERAMIAFSLALMFSIYQNYEKAIIGYQTKQVFNVVENSAGEYTARSNVAKLDSNILADFVTYAMKLRKEKGNEQSRILSELYSPQINRFEEMLFSQNKEYFDEVYNEISVIKAKDKSYRNEIAELIEKYIRKVNIYIDKNIKSNKEIHARFKEKFIEGVEDYKQENYDYYSLNVSYLDRIYILSSFMSINNGKYTIENKKVLFETQKMADDFNVNVSNYINSKNNLNEMIDLISQREETLYKKYLKPKS